MKLVEGRLSGSAGAGELGVEDSDLKCTWDLGAAVGVVVGVALGTGRGQQLRRFSQMLPSISLLHGASFHSPECSIMTQSSCF